MSSPFISEPTPEKFGGTSFTGLLVHYFAATRPMFLTASILPVLAGSAWGWRAKGSFDLLVFLTALLAVALVHAAVNVANDVADARSGTDDRNASRIHPFTGGSRFIQNGVLSQAQMARCAALLLAAGIALGLFLVYFEGLWILAFGAAGIGLGLAYSLPPLRLSARGLGEVAVALGFGVLPFSGAYWLQAETITTEALLLSLPISFWVMAVLVMNEVPDRNADAATGKRTLVVRLGSRRTAWLYAALQVAAFFMLGRPRPAPFPADPHRLDGPRPIGFPGTPLAGNSLDPGHPCAGDALAGGSGLRWGLSVAPQLTEQVGKWCPGAAPTNFLIVEHLEIKYMF
jgi:1,4-dihydroxy-2-naphthoate octaprenyltransferase